MKPSQLVAALKLELANSTPISRKRWVLRIIAEDFSFSVFQPIMQSDKKTITRLLWLFSEIGLESATKLHQELPAVYDLLMQADAMHHQAMANYWLYAGVPESQEAKAIELLFDWLLSPKTPVSIRSRVVLVLFELCKKYPELKQEFVACLHDQRDRYSQAFAKRVDACLSQLPHSA